MTTLCRLPPEVRDKPFDGRRVHLKVIDTQSAPTFALDRLA
jgi:hypothetical protein